MAAMADKIDRDFQANTRLAVSDENPSYYADAVTFTATVSPVPPGGGTRTGTVTFKDGTTTLGPGTLNSAGNATYSIASLAIGNHTITAAYAGDSNFNSSTSAAITQTVNRPDRNGI